MAWGNVMEVRLPLWQLWDPIRVQPFYGALWSNVDGEMTEARPAIQLAPTQEEKAGVDAFAD